MREAGSGGRTWRAADRSRRSRDDERAASPASASIASSSALRGHRSSACVCQCKVNMAVSNQRRSSACVCHCKVNIGVSSQHNPIK
jgi:hypothetical protein